MSHSAAIEADILRLGSWAESIVRLVLPGGPYFFFPWFFSKEPAWNSTTILLHCQRLVQTVQITGIKNFNFKESQGRSRLSDSIPQNLKK